MHRVDPFLATTSSEVKSKENLVNTLPLTAEMALATLMPVKSRVSQHEYTSRPRHSIRHPRHYSGMSSAIGGAVPRVSFIHTTRGERHVIEPIRMLQNCIRYFASHPEVYGTNIRALLDRELLYVMRVKASETALLAPGAVPVTDTPLPPIGLTSRKSQKLEHPALSKCMGWMVTPRSIDAAVSARGVVGGEEMFGLGGTSFVEATPGFLSFLDQASRHKNIPEEIFHSEEYEEGGERMLLSASTPATNFLMDKYVPVDDVSHTQKGSPVRVISFGDPGSGHSSNAVEHNTKILIDGASYEISFLRSQLQQVEAAYNAKCIHLHELQNENNIQKAELQSTDKKLQQCTAKNQELQFQMKNMQRELDAWKQRAREVTHPPPVNASQGSGNVSHRLETMQFGDAKRELAHLSKLWRETEKSLQETKRSLESAEKEADVSHKYLEDAFNLIERLERRNARRDKFIESQRRVRVSLEEKYEKLMWCVQELQTMKGLQSYVDFLLSENPIWSLFLFIRLQSRLMGFAQVDEPLSSPAGPLCFIRTPCGSRLLDAYSPKLVYRLMLDHISGKGNCVESQFQIKYGVLTPRWRAAYLIDYLGGHNNRLIKTSDSNNNDINKQSGDVIEGSDGRRRTLPLLTLSSLLLPQQDIPVVGDIEVIDDVPNSTQYNQATIRLLLYCFWSERLTQYKRETEKRSKMVKEAKAILMEDGVETTGSRTDGYNAFSRPTTFMAALVDFVQQLYPSSTNTGGKETKFTVQKTLVRGVYVRNSGMREHLRMCFSSIVHLTEDGTETPVTLSPQARELLYAMYYYAEEYKEVDSDYRLFYLVAFQQIPEIVGINFFASMEVLRKSCEESLCRFLGANASDHVEKNITDTNHVRAPSSPVIPGTRRRLRCHREDAPSDVLKKTIEIIDTAPLDGESICLEPDSDGEGFGRILPGRRSTVTTTPVEQNVEIPEAYTSPHRLKHNIREYLFPSEDGGDATPTCTKTEDFPGDDVQSKDDDVNNGMPTTWVGLETRLATMLGPHSSFLESFKQAKAADFSKAQSRKRQEFENESVLFSAARGLLPIEEILALVHKHCFTTYAVSCCGGAYLSLAETLIYSNDDNDDDSGSFKLDPLRPIGQVPPTEMHLRRLRFAIAMDQPSSLVRYSDLFNVDSRYGTPSHFHDEYLRLTLDVYLEHQETWMNIILSAVNRQYVGEDKENIEDFDGNISFPVLRSGFANELSRISLGFEQSNLFAKHFLNYSNLLHQEESARHEQFVDAPFFFNAPSLSQDQLDANSLLRQERRWPIEDEASSCSLLYLVLAVRMTYVVWGFDAASTARLLPSLLACDRLRTFPAVEQKKKITDATRESFVREVRREFQDALRRLKTGQAQHNELRRLLSEERGATPPSPCGTSGMKIPSIAREMFTSTPESEMSIDIQRLYAPWENELRQQQQLQQTQGEQGSVPRSGRRSKSQNRLAETATLRVVESTADTAYFPESISLLQFLGLSRVNRAKPEKKKRVENVKGNSDLQTALFETRLCNETLFMSHQTEMVNLITQAGKMSPQDFISLNGLSMSENRALERNPRIVPFDYAEAEDDRNGVSRAYAISPHDSSKPLPGLAQVLLGESSGISEIPTMNAGAKEPTMESIPIRMVHAGCAALSLM